MVIPASISPRGKIWFSQSEAEGFGRVQSGDLPITSGQAFIHNVQLGVADAKTSVTVEGQTGAQVETDNAEISGTITEREVVGYGLDGRIATQLIALTPGVSDQTGQDEGKTGVAGSAKYSVNGGRVQYNIFEVDGADVLNNSINAARGGNTFVVNPSVDAIDEIKVLTSNYGAMYGKTSSGIVQMTTKSARTSFTAMPTSSCATKCSTRATISMTQRGALRSIAATTSAAPSAVRSLFPAYITTPRIKRTFSFRKKRVWKRPRCSTTRRFLPWRKEPATSTMSARRVLTLP